MVVDDDDKQVKPENDAGAPASPETPKNSKSEAKPEGTRLSTMMDVRGVDKSSSESEVRDKDKLRDGT